MRLRLLGRVVHINPDHFLETPAGRVWTVELNNEAWAKCFCALDDALRAADASARVYVLVGAQGSGKSTWARNRAATEPSAIIFDAILVKRSERRPIIDKAMQRGHGVVAIWFRTPLETCLLRNAARPADEVAGEQGLRNVHAALEPPTVAEGFVEVIEILCDD